MAVELYKQAVLDLNAGVKNRYLSRATINGKLYMETGSRYYYVGCNLCLVTAREAVI